MEKSRPNIDRNIQEAMLGSSKCTKSQVWAIHIVHSIELQSYLKNEVDMKDLRSETQKQNTCELAAPPRYLTTPSIREEKTNWSIVIALQNREDAKQMMQRKTYIFNFTP